MTTIPPPPAYPPSAGQPADPPVYTPTPIDPTPADAAPADQLDDAARRFWAPAQKLAQEWWRATGPDRHLTDQPVLPPVTDWETTGDQPDDTAHRVADRIALLLSETEKERAARHRAERDAAYAAAGETERQRTARHKREKRARATTARRRQIAREMLDSSKRAPRFRKWALLTAISAAIGWKCGLVQICGVVIRNTNGGPPVAVGAGAFLVGLGYAVDWYLRGGARDGGATAVTDVRRARIPLLIVTRIPVASALLALLAYTPGTLT